jgi:uncharacterized protein YoxC
MNTPVNLENMDDDAVVRDLILRMNNLQNVRSKMFIRVAKRVTGLTRTVMISAGLISIFGFVLVLMMAWQFDNMVNVMTTMNQRFRTMSEDMTQMRHLIDNMDSSVAAMPAIVTRVQSMEHSVAGMNTDMGVIRSEMISMDQRIDQVRHNVVRMSTTFNHMDGAVLGIGQDVNVMSKPMKDYNILRSIMPFP